MEKLKSIHTVVFTLYAVSDLPNICISPVDAIYQVGRQPQLILDFTWSALNQSTNRVSLEEAMCFGGSITRIVQQVLITDPSLGPVYPSKVELANTNMCLWVQMEDTPSTAFLLPKLNPCEKKLVGFHLSLPMGWVDSDPFFA